MYQIINENDFANAFKAMNRGANFSRNGLAALYEYLTDMEEDESIGIELDVIAVCCEYIEYENFKALQQNYTDVETMKELEENTQVIKIPAEGFIIQNY